MMDQFTQGLFQVFSRNRGRLVDIPQWTTTPLLFTYQQTAVLQGGVYDFTNPAQKIAFTPNRPILGNVLYIFRTMSFGCDIEANDYQAAISTSLSFSMYQQSDAAAPGLREPMRLVTYMQNFPYVLSILGQELQQKVLPRAVSSTLVQATQWNRLLGYITGVLTQTPALIGKASITATLVFTCEEVKDKDYIAAYTRISTPGVKK